MSNSISVVGEVRTWVIGNSKDRQKIANYRGFFWDEITVN